MPVRLSSLGAVLHVKQSASTTSTTSFIFIITTKNNNNSPNNASSSSYSHGCDKRRLFHVSLPLRNLENRNHYEALNVQTNASPQDIKKSFYSLSKAHHPDHNRSDPHASRRFMRISEAYKVLSSPDQRAKYDRDVLRLHDLRASSSSSSGLHHHHHRGSYSSTSSTGPAGARPASGLSRRRGTFRGPPPSFYRSGGWGAYGDKRSKAHEESTGGGGARTASDHANRERDFYSAAWEAGTRERAGGMGYGQQPFGRGTSNTGDMPHFNSEARAAHTRTQATVDAIRARKMARAAGATMGGPTGDFGEVGTFFAIVGVLGLAISVPYLLWSVWTGPQKPSREKRELLASAR